MRAMLTRREAAANMNLSISTIDRMIQRGELPSVKLGSAVRIPYDALLALVSPCIANRGKDRRRAREEDEMARAMLGSIVLG